LVRALGNGLQRAGGSLGKVDAGETMKALFTQAAKAAVDGQGGEIARVEAIQLLGLTSYDASGATLLSLLAPQQPQTIQLAALSALSRFAEPRIANELTQFWGDFKPRLRSEALSILLSRPERAAVLLEAIKNGIIQPSDLTTAQIKFLRNHGNQGVRESALKILGPATPNKRQEVIDAYQAALSLPGDAARGRQIYLERCSSCHRLGGQGFALGPDLVTVKNTGKEKMLVNILDPNREVAPPYIAFQIDTKDGESLIGVIVNDSSSSITVRQAFGKEDAILRSNVRRMLSQGQSLMPEGLEQGLSPGDFASLLEYISMAEADK
jgi:putative heme-binding domain-containing protein